jgi:hypothetical protein
MHILFLIYFLYSIIIGIHVDDERFIYFLPDFLLDLLVAHGLEGEFLILLLLDLIDDVGDDFGEVQVNKSSG